MKHSDFAISDAESTDEIKINAMLDQVMACSELFNLLHSRGASDLEVVHLALFPDLCQRLLHAINQPCFSTAYIPTVVEIFYDDRLMLRIEHQQICYQAADLESCQFNLFENRIDGEMALLMVGNAVLLDRLGFSHPVQLANLN